MLDSREWQAERRDRKQSSQINRRQIGTAGNEVLGNTIYRLPVGGLRLILKDVNEHV